MKKVMFLAAVAMVFCLVGCKKKVDCKCTTTMNGEVMQEVTLTGVESCSELSVTQTINGVTQVTNCSEI